jgi:hypothetical protein
MVLRGDDDDNDDENAEEDDDDDGDVLKRRRRPGEERNPALLPMHADADADAERGPPIMDARSSRDDGSESSDKKGTCFC